MQLLAPVQTHFEIEAHPIAATVHLRGSLTAARAMAAMNACHALPGDVRALVVDP